MKSGAATFSRVDEDSGAVVARRCVAVCSLGARRPTWFSGDGMTQLAVR